MTTLHSENGSVFCMAATPDQAKANGFAQFNGGPHLCVNVPNGSFTISARTPSGQLVTFAFIGNGNNENGHHCIDIKHHNSGYTTKNGDRDVPTQRAILWTPGQSIARAEFKDACTLATILL